VSKAEALQPPIRARYVLDTYTHDRAESSAQPPAPPSMADACRDIPDSFADLVGLEQVPATRHAQEATARSPQLRALRPGMHPRRRSRNHQRRMEQETL